MARSRKKPIIKDKSLKTGEYWRRIRRNWKNTTQKWATSCSDPDLPCWDSLQYRHPHSIVNPWDRCDWVYNLIKYQPGDFWYETKLKASRK